MLFVAASLLLAVAMISCGKKDDSGAAESAAPAANANAKPVDPATAGTVSGTIKLDGAAPKMKTINMAAEPNCAKIHADSPAMTEDVVTGDGGRLCKTCLSTWQAISALTVSLCHPRRANRSERLPVSSPTFWGVMAGQSPERPVNS